MYNGSFHRAELFNDRRYPCHSKMDTLAWPLLSVIFHLQIALSNASEYGASSTALG